MVNEARKATVTGGNSNKVCVAMNPTTWVMKKGLLSS